jgi:hypothetical protein
VIYLDSSTLLTLVRAETHIAEPTSWLADPPEARS